MANQLAEVTPKLLAQGLLALRQFAITPRLVNRGYESLAGEKGSTIDVPIPSAIAAVAVVPAANNPVTADIAPTSANIVLDQWFEAPFYLTDKDMMEAMNGTIPMQASEAIKALANNVDRYILGLYKKFYGSAGTAGTVPFDNGTTSDATNLRKVLNKQLAPLDDRHVVFDPDAEASALNLRAFQDASYSGDVQVIMDGMLNRKLGFQWWMDQNVLSHTAGTITDDPTVTGANAVGATSINVTTDAGDAVNLLEGDLISFAGDDQQQVVTADVTIGASSSGDIPIYPGISVATTGGETFTVVGDHVANLGFHRDAIAFANRPLADAGQGLGVITQSATDPVSGLTLRLEISREHKRTRFSYDILYGAEAIRPELGARLLG